MIMIMKLVKVCAKDGGARLDCEWGFIWLHYQLAFLFHRKDILPTSFSMKSNILLPLPGHELSAKQHKSYQVTFIKFLSRERGDLPSLHNK